MAIATLLISILAISGIYEKQDIIFPPYSPKFDTVVDIGVLHYDAHLNFPMTDASLNGSVEITFVVNDVLLDSVWMDAATQIQIDSVVDSTGALTFTRTDDGLWIYPIYSLYYGDTTSFKIYYSIAKADTGLYYVSDPYPTLYTLGCPEITHYWLPCREEHYQKATFKLTADVPAGYVVASNGNALDSTTLVWETNYLTAPYLISINISKYVAVKDTAIVDGDTIPLVVFVYPEDTSDAETVLNIHKQALLCYTEIYGSYPFLGEKYGAVEVSSFIYGGMEHQTITTLISSVLTDEDVLAHELAHSWWGDMVTCKDWRNVWLNEGFATYTEALYFLYTYSEDRFKTKLSDYKSNYLYGAWDFPIADPPPDQIFNYGVIYCKGAWVLHMVRCMLGDSTFYSILSTHRDSFAYKTATIEEFINICQDVSGEDLGWFFDQWVYNKGYPDVRWWYNYVPEDSILVISYSQVQDTQEVPIFRLPLEFGLVYGTDTTIASFWDSLAVQVETIYCEAEPDTVILDPHLKVLQRAFVVAGSELKRASPLPHWRVKNPVCTNRLIIDGNFSEIRMYDITGRLCKTITHRYTTLNLPSGVYYLKDAHFTQKVVIIR